ncbi:MAG TPA: ATP-dependent helicase HrpB [Xanthobacteraceae bacterium]|nr:ATP-dependent helicase HrpB [Xanthobacteraceae bacterium]
MTFVPALPIDEVLPRLISTLREGNVAVLVAPPGAGKTTRVPLVLAQEPWAAGKILVLEPRRLAARAAAERMASTLGEKVGETVGYRVRFSSQVSRRTRIEVLTEGVFTRMVLDDPALPGVVAVLFDEFHERSLDADLGLALARDVQQGLREDLKLLVMSATIDGARIARHLGNAPTIESAGQSFPVETRYVGRDPRVPIERAVADAVMRALRSEQGSVLAFLPGAGEIRRTETLLREAVADPAVDIVPLHGALDWSAQNQAIAPAPAGRRKVVLATSIAETSLTIEGVRILIDSGLARVPRYEPDVGLTRLETVRVSRAAADQRRGRAGRTEPGVCIRLWDEPQTASLQPFATPEILAADLSGFVLDLAQWGVSDPKKLVFLDPPPEPALAEARALLAALGAIDADGRITEEGRRLNRLPLAPRLARMVLDAAAEGEGALAAEIAAILTERGLGGDDVDLRNRLDALRRDRSRRAEDARRMAARWVGLAADKASQPERPVPSPASRGADSTSVLSPGAVLALAYPERIAKNRGAGGAFLLANGRGGSLDPACPLAREPFLAVAELAGSAAQARILLAAPISLAEIERRFAARIDSRDEISFDPQSASLRGRRLKRLGALVLAEQPLRVTPDDDTPRLLAEGIARLGLDRLPWTKSLRQWRDRVMFMRRIEGDEWPDLSDATLAATAGDWLASMLMFKTTLDQITADELNNALHALVSWKLQQRLDTEAPTHFAAPSGSAVPIDYAAPDGPKLSIRVQELFGLDRHPCVASGKIPLVVELLSPANRPVQVTRDLPGFWRGSYAAVKAEMKGRYPKHSWPDDPLTAPATRRAKRSAR